MFTALAHGTIGELFHIGDRQYVPNAAGDAPHIVRGGWAGSAACTDRGDSVCWPSADATAER
jgi:hypothetical protein